MTSTTIVDKPTFSLCIKSKNFPESKINIPGEKYQFSVHESIDLISDCWDAMIPPEYFHSSMYLRTLEKSNPSNLRQFYAVFYDENKKAVGITLFQCIILKMASSFKYEKYSTDHSFYSRWWQRFQQFVVSFGSFRMLTVGNMYLTGQYGFQFVDPSFSPQDKFRILTKAVKVLKKELCNTPYRFQGALYKDYFNIDRPGDVSSLGLNEFHIDPNMILTLRKSWTTFDDYLLDMKSKYRLRLKNAMKKFTGVERRVLDENFIRENHRLLFHLYDKILTGSGFVLAKGKEDYFIRLKEEFGDRLHVVGYFLNNELIAFYSWILESDKKMDSHFIGLEPSINLKYQIYLNILMDLVRHAIDQKAQDLYYFRTALEIKSSVGAIPHDMSCYFKHNNFLINKFIIPPAFKYFVPKQHWIQRHPFKSY